VEEIKVKVHGVIVDPISRGFAVILINEEETEWLPIFIGPFEAQSIAAELEHFRPPRPFTHDLMKNIFEELNIKIIKAVVVELKENTFFATLHIEQNGKRKEIDARPSDAIAIALRTNSPIYVAKEVMEKAGQKTSAPKEKEDEKTKKIKELQKKLREAVDNEDYETAAKIKEEIKLASWPPEKVELYKSLKAKLEKAKKEENIEEINRIQQELKKLE
jgi:bifunctional DNase/RNase